MANAKRDGNHVPSLIAVLNSDGQSIELLYADPTTHHLKTTNGTTGSDAGPANALHDQNHTPTMMAVSSADGKTPVVLYTDSSNNLLIKST